MENAFKNYNCIGILGGTFNPVHKGHTMLAREVINQFNDIEQLILMPNNIPAYKDTDDIISSYHRINMLMLASDDLPKVSISDLEIIRGGTTYTIDTLRQIKAYNQNIKIYFIIGADSLYNIEKWKDYTEIFKNCTILAAKRDCNMEDIKAFSMGLLEKYPYLNIEFLETEAIDISSSQLREDIKNGILDKDYLDNNIIDYIKVNKLYGWKQSYES